MWGITFWATLVYKTLKLLLVEYSGLAWWFFAGANENEEHLTIEEKYDTILAEMN